MSKNQKPLRTIGFDIQSEKNKSSSAILIPKASPNSDKNNLSKSVPTDFSKKTSLDYDSDDEGIEERQLSCSYKTSMYYKKKLKQQKQLNAEKVQLENSQNVNPNFPNNKQKSFKDDLKSDHDTPTKVPQEKKNFDHYIQEIKTPQNDDQDTKLTGEKTEDDDTIFDLEV